MPFSSQKGRNTFYFFKQLFHWSTHLVLYNQPTHHWKKPICGHKKTGKWRLIIKLLHSKKAKAVHVFYWECVGVRANPRKVHNLLCVDCVRWKQMLLIWKSRYTISFLPERLINRERQNDDRDNGGSFPGGNRWCLSLMESYKRMGGKTITFKWIKHNKATCWATEILWNGLWSEMNEV